MSHLRREEFAEILEMRDAGVCLCVNCLRIGSPFSICVPECDVSVNLMAEGAEDLLMGGKQRVAQIFFGVQSGWKLYDRISGLTVTWSPLTMSYESIVPSPKAEKISKVIRAAALGRSDYVVGESLRHPDPSGGQAPRLAQSSTALHSSFPSRNEYELEEVSW